jgi:hypothetical protein
MYDATNDRLVVAWDGATGAVSIFHPDDGLFESGFD